MKRLLRAIMNSSVKNQILFTLGVIVAFRVGSFIPAPGVDYANVQTCVSGEGASGVLGILSVFSGGALLQLSVFALGIMPYITASIIVQLLRVVIPRFEALYKEGQDGQAKLTQYTRYLTLALATLQGITLVVTARNGALFNGCGADNSLTPLLVDNSIMTTAMAVLTLVAGTALVMWMAELVTERGVGNGMSILILISIVSALPAALWTAATAGGIGVLTSVIALLIALVAVVTFVEQSQRRIGVTYPNRSSGKISSGNSATYIPLKINMAGVVPVIFASSILMLPAVVGQFFPDEAWATWIVTNFSDQSSPYYIGLLAFLVIAFAFFYASITFNPIEQADNLAQYGGFIPGYRPGKNTADYLGYVMTRLTSVGAVYLALVAIVPTMIFGALGITSIPFGGTSLLIIVSVGLDTVKQIQTRIGQKNYAGLFK